MLYESLIGSNKDALRVTFVGLLDAQGPKLKFKASEDPKLQLQALQAQKLGFKLS